MSFCKHSPLEQRKRRIVLHISDGSFKHGLNDVKQTVKREFATTITYRPNKFLNNAKHMWAKHILMITLQRCEKKLIQIYYCLLN